MTRTNIDIDDELVGAAMRKYGLHSRKEAVHLALQRLVGTPLTGELLRDIEGIGWDGDLDEMRGGQPTDARN